MGVAHAFEHHRQQNKRVLFQFVIHLDGFCSRAWENYKQRQFKIVTPIMIMGFVIGLYPFRNGEKILVITNTSFLF